MKADDIEKLFLRRHSSRSFSSEDVNIKDIGVITKAGLSAPCGMGRHCSHLFVFKKGDEAYKRLTSIVKDKTGRDAFYDAPIIIMECVDKDSVAPIRDGSAVIENMLLAASMLNLGACWIHAPSKVFINEDKHLLKKIDIDENYQVIDAIVVGHNAK